VAAAPAAKPSGPPIKLAVGNLAFPSLASPIIAIVQDQQLGAKHGLDLEIMPYAAIAAYYAALNTGEVQTLVGGPHVLQRLRGDGAPLNAVATYAKASAIGVITGKPEIQSLMDLRGKRLAADMASSEFQIIALYAQAQGLNLRQDVTVVQAGPPQVRTLLQTGEVEAGMTWEPSLTLNLADSPSYRIILNGDEAWRAVSNTEGWELAVLMREDYTTQNPQAVQRWIATLQEAVQLIRTDLDKADEIVAREVKLPPGTFKQAVSSGRMVYEVAPTWEPRNRDALRAMFQAAVDGGYLPKLPDDKAIYTP
jgi:ABC-type nitrate/sulfonate/bicarbonate transport system substrate-binding protein